MNTKKISISVGATLAFCLSCSYAEPQHKPTSCPSGSDMQQVLTLMKTRPELYDKELQSYRVDHYTPKSGVPQSVLKWMADNTLAGQNGGIHLGKITPLNPQSQISLQNVSGILKSISKKSVTDWYCDYSANLSGTLASKYHPMFVLAESY